jgi:hypothetical protein
MPIRPPGAQGGSGLAYSVAEGAQGSQTAGVSGEESRRATTLELFVMWVVVRLLAGRPNACVVKRSGYGLMGDMALGLVGSLLGGWIVLALGACPWVRG